MNRFIPSPSSPCPRLASGSFLPPKHSDRDVEALLRRVVIGGCLIMLGLTTSGARGEEDPRLSSPEIERIPFSNLVRKANDGDPAAQVELGLQLLQRKVPRDPAQALRWFRLAADQGSAKATRQIGVIYSRGDGVNRDYKEALRWFHLAVKRGNATAMADIGVCHANGEGVAKDQAEAAKWYRRSALAGDASGGFYYGMCLQRGEGLPKNEKEALHWFLQAAAMGYSRAQLSVGLAYQLGHGCDIDHPEAIKWLSKASAQDLGEAHVVLAGYYALGEFVQQDMPEAYCLALRASKQRVPNSNAVVAALAAGMTPEQIAEGTKRARLTIEERKPGAPQHAPPPSDQIPPDPPKSTQNYDSK